MAQAAIKTFSRERDAKRAARTAGLADDRFVTQQNAEGRFFYVVKADPKVERPAGVRKEAPEGKRAVVLALASRPEGVSRSELIEQTGWAKAPWKWLFSNPQGTGLCDRYGYAFRVETTGRNNQYFVSV